MQMETKQKLKQQKLYQKKLDLKTKAITKDRKGHCIMTKGKIQEEDLTIVNIGI